MEKARDLSDNFQLVVETTIDDISRDEVWNYFTVPEHICQWNNASDDWHTPHAVNDLRVGGRFLSRMEAKDGSFGFDFNGTYTTVVKPEIFEYILADDRKVKVEFIQQGSAVQIVERFEPENVNPTELQQAGWQAILNNFKRYVEGVK